MAGKASRHLGQASESLMLSSAYQECLEQFGHRTRAPRVGKTLFQQRNRKGFSCPVLLSQACFSLGQRTSPFPGCFPFRRKVLYRDPRNHRSYTQAARAVSRPEDAKHNPPSSHVYALREPPALTVPASSHGHPAKRKRPFPMRVFPVARQNRFWLT